MTLFLDPLPCHVYTFRETTTSNQLIWLIYWVLQTVLAPGLPESVFNYS